MARRQGVRTPRHSEVNRHPLMRNPVSDWYDNFTDHQTRIGINIRHRTILRNAKRAGLRNGMHILEIGCGIGSVTSLLAKANSKGSVLGVDISPKSIELARKNLAKRKNVRFQVSDMSDFRVEHRFDLVVLPDVIEHIPVEQHPALFATIAAHLVPNGRVLINVPNAQLLEYLHKHQPQTLQVIDQPIHIDSLMRVVYDQGLLLEEMHGYGLRYDLAEYTSILLRPAFAITTPPEKPKLRRILEELRSRI